ncbi:MAG: beta-ketoacyl-[acyl-carrier-protein] synthase family protein [Planctomycetaceae bacterium]
MATSMDSRNIVVTGLGILSPIGIGADAFWDSLANCRSGVAKIGLMDYCGAPRNIGGEVKDFTVKTAKKDYLKQQRKSIKVMCREIQLGVASALQSVAHSGIDLEAIDHGRFGVDFGANLMLSPPDVLANPASVCVDNGDESRAFHFERWGRTGGNADAESGMAVMEPLWLLKYLPNMPGCHIGIAVDARGPNNSLTLAEASGNLALGEARRIMQRRAADIMIAGVTGTRLHPIKSLHAAMWDDLADFDDPPETWSRPFDARRNGEVLGEGACSLLLEDEAAATARGATIYARILGSGASCVADRTGTPDRRQALVNAMQSAFRDADLQPDDIGHIHAHGLSSVDCDREEAAAIVDVFGGPGTQPPVTALTSYFGNCGSGCGLLELAGSILALRRGVVPATLNYEKPDPDCPLNVVRGEPRSVANKTVLNINVTRMGQASASIARVD